MSDRRSAVNLPDVDPFARPDRARALRAETIRVYAAWIFQGGAR